MSLPAPDYRYLCEVIRWLDADTCEVAVDLGWKITARQVVRLYGCNAPELHSTDPEEKRRGQAALDFATSLAPAGTRVLIQSYKPQRPTEKFGRWLAWITLPDGTELSERLIQAGHAVTYYGGKRA